MSRSRWLVLAAIVSFLMVDMTGASGSPGPNPSRRTWPRASPVTVEVLGTVDAVNDPTDLLDGSVVVGGAISVLYQISPDASPDPFSQPAMADYWGAIGPRGLSLKVGSYLLHNGPNRVQVTMVDGGTYADGLFDGWYVWAPNPRVRQRAIQADLTIFLALYDGTAEALGSTALVPMPSLEAWPGARIGVSRSVTTGLVTYQDLFIAGEITSIRAVD